MRTPAALLLIGCLAAVPGGVRGQTSILPPAATLNPQNAGAQGLGPQGSASPRGEALSARSEVGSTLAGALSHGQDRSQDRNPERGRRAEIRPPHGRTCFNQAEARETITARRLIDPVRALRAGRQQGDALSAKLCRWTAEEFVYEIAVLRHDGRILHLFMDAQNGDAVGAPAQAGQAAQAGARAPERDR